MTRFVTELHTRPEMPVKGAANSRLGKRLVSIFSVAKPPTNQVSDDPWRLHRFTLIAD